MDPIENIRSAINPYVKDIFKLILNKETISRKLDENLKLLILSELNTYFELKSDSSDYISDNTSDDKSTIIEKDKIKTIQKVESKSLNIDPKKCICRIWNTGLGTQCSRDKKNGDYCKNHFTKSEEGVMEFGIITEDRPTHYLQNTELKGKKGGGLIKWKNTNIPIVVKTLVDTELTIEDKEEINKISKVEELSETDEIEEIKNEFSNMGFNNEYELDEDETNFEIEDEIELNGIVYTQYKYDENIVYILNNESKKVAEWDGCDKDTIDWI